MPCPWSSFARGWDRNWYRHWQLGVSWARENRVPSLVRLTALWSCLSLTKSADPSLWISHNINIHLTIENSANKDFSVVLIYYLYNVGPIESSGYLNNVQVKDFRPVRAKILDIRMTHHQWVYFVWNFWFDLLKIFIGILSNTIKI